MIETLGSLGLDLVVVIGAGLVLVLALRFGGALTDALPMSRARRQMVSRLRPVAGAVLVVLYVLVVLRWFLRGEAELAPYVLVLVGAFVAFASWAAVRDVLEGAYVRAAHTFSEGDRVQVGSIRGRIQKLGYRNLYIEGSDGELAIVPYRILSTQPILRSSDVERTAFHVFRVEVPAGMDLPLAKRTVKETALLCHWSSVARAPQVVAAGPGELEVTVFAVDGDRVGEIETVVRRSLAQAQLDRPAVVKELTGRT